MASASSEACCLSRAVALPSSRNSARTCAWMETPWANTGSSRRSPSGFTARARAVCCWTVRRLQPAPHTRERSGPHDSASPLPGKNSHSGAKDRRPVPVTGGVVRERPLCSVSCHSTTPICLGPLSRRGHSRTRWRCETAVRPYQGSRAKTHASKMTKTISMIHGILS